jgi:hypothetical protein
MTNSSEKTPFQEKVISLKGSGRILDEKPQVFKKKQNRAKKKRADK